MNFFEYINLNPGAWFAIVIITLIVVVGICAIVDSIASIFRSKPEIIHTEYEDDDNWF